MSCASLESAQALKISHTDRPQSRMKPHSARYACLKAAVAAVVGAMPLLNCALAAGLPSFKQVKQDWRASDAWLLDRNGRELQRVRLDHTVRRFTWTQAGDISPALKDALLASEGPRFYEHGDVAWFVRQSAAWP